MRILRLLHLLGPHGKIKVRFGQWGEDVIVHRNFDKQKHGFYIKCHFEADPSVIAKVRGKLAIKDDIQLQHYRAC